jgi:CubicO group peptidase (beta-lactamase class C family)
MRSLKGVVSDPDATLIVLIVGLFAACSASPVWGFENSVGGRIAAVENGLLPWVQIEGGPLVKWTLSERMGYHKVPAVSVALIDDYRIEWARAWGVTEPGGHQQATPETMFQAGSISKAVGAMGVMRLVQDDKLNLDSDVNQELKTWKIHDNEFTRIKPVTLRELLSHSAMTSVHGFPGYDLHAPLPTLEQVLDGTEPANTHAVRVEAVPGSGWKYSGGGYEIIQQLVMDTTRQSFPDFMRTTVLEPLAMNHSTYEQPLPLSLQPDAAVGALSDGKEVAGKWHIYPEMMAAGLWTTPSDLARFGIAVMNTTRGLSNPVISAATGRLMLTPQIDTGSPELGKDGLGVFLYGTGTLGRFVHDGADEGFQAILIGFYSGQGVVVMTNSNNGFALAGEIFRSVAHEYEWPVPKPQTRRRMNVDPAIWNRYIGRYRFSAEVTASVTREGAHLYFQQDPLRRTELYASTDQEYFSLDFPGKLTFRVGSNGNASGLTVHAYGSEFSGTRIE